MHRKAKEPLDFCGVMEMQGRGNVPGKFGVKPWGKQGAQEPGQGWWPQPEPYRLQGGGLVC